MQIDSSSPMTSIGCLLLRIWHYSFSSFYSTVFKLVTIKEYLLPTQNIFSLLLLKADIGIGAVLRTTMSGLLLFLSLPYHFANIIHVYNGISANILYTFYCF